VLWGFGLVGRGKIPIIFACNILFVLCPLENVIVSKTFFQKKKNTCPDASRHPFHIFFKIFANLVFQTKNPPAKIL
jgi:hypothetical protein